MNALSMRPRPSIWFAVGAVLAMLATLMVVGAWRVEANPGDDDTTFVPITPCRLFDTRSSGDVPFGPNVWRSFRAHGTNGDCIIPTTAVGLSTNVTAVDATMLTFLTVWPDDEPMPLASSLNPAPGQPPTPNAVTTELSPGGRFRIYNLQGVVDVIVDVNGYYVKASLRSGLERIEGPVHTVAPGNAFNELATSCPMGKLAINGGVVNTSSNGLPNDFDRPLLIIASDPDSTLTSWNVTVFNDTAVPQYFRKWILCAAD